MNRRKIWIVVAMISVVLGIVLGVGFYGHGVGRRESVTILTATKGGTYYPLGRGLAQILKGLPSIKDANAVLTNGSIANIERLLHKKDNIVAFTMASHLVRNTEANDQLCVLARLYDDVMQIVVRKGANITSIEDLEGKNVYLGHKRSGTRRIAMRIIQTINDANSLEERMDITDDHLEKTLGENYEPDKNPNSFNDAARMLRKGELDAAFVMAGTPTEAVRDALNPYSSLRDAEDKSHANECTLLGLDSETVVPQQTSEEPGSYLGLKPHLIRKMVYGKYQPTAITTVASDVLLICRRDLNEDLAAVIVKSLFYDTERLELAHSKALEIKLTEALAAEDLPLEWHPGVEKFLKETLLIATGAMKGHYYHLGRRIQEQLEAWGISAVTIHTDGSIENASLLKDYHAIAIMQHDAALAAQSGSLESIYGESSSGERIARVEGIRRIATGHYEQVHVVMRRTERLKEIIEEYNKDRFTDEQIEEITSLDTLRNVLKATGEEIEVCVGPRKSGTRSIAKAILEQHELDEDYVTECNLPVSDMVDRLHKGNLDAGFFVGHVPTGALLSVIEDASAFRLLSLGSRQRAQMRSAVFKMSTIDPNTYPCQLKGQMIRTIATRAVLVTTEDLPERFPVRDITEAIFHGEAYLGIEGLTKEAMAERLPSLELHSGAEKHYKTEEILGLSPPPMHWLRQTWTILTCLTMLVTVMFIPGYTGLIIVRRNRTANEIGRRILAIPLGASVQHSVQRLLNIRDEIQERVRRRWWRWGELDKHRWRYLRDLLHDRIGEAKENLTRAFVIEIRAVMSNTELTDARRQKQCRSIENRILEFFGKGELDPSQQKILRELLRECGQQNAKTRESKGGKK